MAKWDHDDLISKVTPTPAIAKQYAYIYGQPFTSEHANELLDNLDSPLKEEEQSFNFTFNEDEYLKELLEYIKETYRKHYSKNARTGKKKTQTLERIIENGRGTGFVMGNISKYCDRYGEKKGFNREDILKLVHYGLIQLYIHDLENLSEKD